MPRLSFALGEKIFLFGGAFTNCQPLWKFEIYRTPQLSFEPSGSPILVFNLFFCYLWLFSVPLRFVLIFRIGVLFFAGTSAAPDR